MSRLIICITTTTQIFRIRVFMGRMSHCRVTCYCDDASTLSPWQTISSYTRSLPTCQPLQALPTVWQTITLPMWGTIFSHPDSLPANHYIHPLPTITMPMWQTIFSHLDSLPAYPLAQPLPLASHCLIVNICSKPRLTVILKIEHFTAQMLKHMFSIETQLQRTGTSHRTVYLTFKNSYFLF